MSPSARHKSKPGVVGPRPTGTAKGQDTGYAARALTALREAGMRITQPRRRIVTLLSQVTTAMTAGEVHAQLRRQRIDVDQASVYRTLGLLEQHGLIHKVGDRGGVVRCERQLGGPRQLMMICRRCGRVVSIPMPSGGAWLREAARHGFHVDGSTLELRGLCGTCPHAS